MDPTTRAIAEALRRWDQAPSATIIPFPTPAERLQREWVRKQRQLPPMRPLDPRPAA